MQINIWKETLMILDSTKSPGVIMEVFNKKIILKEKEETFIATYDENTESFFIQINEDTKIEHQYQDMFLEIFRGTSMYQHNGIEGI